MNAPRVGRGQAVVAVALVGVGSFTGVVAIARAVAPSSSVADVRAKVAASGPRGPRGFPGPKGPTGLRGLPGPTGPAAVTPSLKQSISINWQNGFANATGRDTQTFVVPHIGQGQVTCNQQTQWVWFKPYDQSYDVAMWTVKIQGNTTTVRTARHTLFTGNSFFEGMNDTNGTESEAQGSFLGIISQRGVIGQWSGGPGPPPTTFKLSWYWNFNDATSARCFVAGSFISARS